MSIPSGVTLLYGTKVKVIIQVEESPVQKNFDLSIKVHNSKGNQEVVLATQTVKVGVEGKKQIMDKITTQDIKAYVDVAGLDIGTHEIEIIVDAPGDLQLLSTEPQVVKVEIKEAQGEPVTEESSDKP